MANRHRGESVLMVGGQALPMRLTLGALAELEQAFAVDSLPALGERFATGKLSARDVVRILAAGLRGAGRAFSDDEVAGFAFEGGLNGAIRAAIDLLDVTFGDPSNEAGAPAGTAARPSQPPAT